MQNQADRLTEVIQSEAEQNLAPNLLTLKPWFLPVPRQPLGYLTPAVRLSPVLWRIGGEAQTELQQGEPWLVSGVLPT